MILCKVFFSVSKTLCCLSFILEWLVWSELRVFCCFFSYKQRFEDIWKWSIFCLKISSLQIIPTLGFATCCVMFIHIQSSEVFSWQGRSTLIDKTVCLGLKSDQWRNTSRRKKKTESSSTMKRTKWSSELLLGMFLSNKTHPPCAPTTVCVCVCDPSVY